MAEGSGQRQHPHNLQGILRMAVEAGSASDGPAPQQAMSEEVWHTGAVVVTASLSRLG